MLLEKYKICVTITNNRKRYFIYEDGYWKEIRKEFIASIIFQWLKPKDRTTIIAEKITDALFMYKNIFIDENKFNAKVNKVNLQIVHIILKLLNLNHTILMTTLLIKLIMLI